MERNKSMITKSKAGSIVSGNYKTNIEPLTRNIDETFTINKSSLINLNNQPS